MNFKNNIPIFLHQSYAEYFLAKRGLDIINETRIDKDKIISQILFKSEFFLVRKFLNDSLSLYEFKMKVNTKKKSEEQINSKKDKTIYVKNRETLTKRIKNIFGLQNYKFEIENCCNENLFYLLKYLLDVKRVRVDLNNEFLLLASHYSHNGIIELLIEREIDVNQTNKDGENALHLASEQGHKEIVQLLIEKGIDINKTNKDGQNALHLASKRGHKEIVALLIEKGIKK